MRDYKDSQADGGPARWMRLRVKLMGAFFFICLSLVLARAVKLQVFENDRLRGYAQDQYVRQIEIPARRGDIFDRRGVPLAQSVEVDSIWIDPSQVQDLKGAASSLAKVLKLDAPELQARLQKAKRFAWVKRQARPEEVAGVNALGLSGIGLTKEPRRFYPQRELAAQVIGMVGTDGRGLEGLELAFNDELTGENSRLPGFRDARGRKLLLEGDIDPVEREGASVTLTLDRHVQYVTEKALVRAVETSKALAGWAVVLEPSTGALLALANAPVFNPNSPSDSPKSTYRNRAALDAFEPGSTFKTFVIAEALERSVIRPTDTFFCENGAWSLGKHTINDSHPHGWLTPAKVLQVSSNIGASKIAQLLGRERLVDAYGRFGFGERAGLALPGEGKGVIPFPKSEVALATESYGQGLTATAVQLTSAYGAIANGGVLMRPYLVSKVVDPDGLVLLENSPASIRRVVSEATARKVVSMLEGVVEKEGTAPKAKMDEYRVAGKTGTAQKADPVVRGYSDKRIASFIGMVPAEDPRVVVLIVVDEPQTDVYGGNVAAPAFKEIAAAVMPYFGVRPSKVLPAAAVAATPAPPEPDRTAGLQLPKAASLKGALAAAFAKVERQEAVTEQAETGSVQVPDLSGEVAHDAVKKLLGVALEPRLSGSGRVISQSPDPGTWVGKGARVTVQLANELPLETGRVAGDP